MVFINSQQQTKCSDGAQSQYNPIENTQPEEVIAACPKRRLLLAYQDSS
jgi:hypothetical protein